MTTWNYRIVQIKDGDGPGHDLLMLTEVYYDEAGNPVSYSRDSSIMGNDLEEIQRVLDKMSEAVAKDAIDVPRILILPTTPDKINIPNGH